MTRLHIVGCPRSGTTLLMELLATCFDCYRLGGHETSIFAPLPEGARGQPVLLSKQPTDIKVMARVLAVDPHLHVLYVVRDPRAAISSRHTAFAGPGYFVNYRIWRECEVAARTLLDHPRVLQLRYEDLVSYPDIHQQIIADRFPFLQQRHAFSDFARHARPDSSACHAMNGLRAVDTASLGKWRHHLPRVKAQLLAHPMLQRDLEYRRYERDDAWQSVLDGIRPVDFPCRYPDRQPWLREAEREVRQWFKLRRYRRQTQARIFHASSVARAFQVES